METMRYNETKKSSKGVIFGLLLFSLIGGAIIFFAIKSETKPVVVGQTKSDVQRLVDTEASTNKKEENSAISYEVKDKTSVDKSNQKIKSNITLPEIYVAGEALTDINETIDKKYTELFSGLKEQLASAKNNFTYTVTYNSYDNMVGSDKILSLTLYQRVTDDAAKKNTSEKIETYNIDLATKKQVDQADTALEILGKDYKSKIGDSVKNYVVSKKMISEADFTYVVTGLENFYIKESKFHIVFNEGELVDKKYSVIDITVE
jgi:hypothetical protein